LVGLGYFSPVLFLIGFLVVTKLRERRD
jgi:hypothetical protein